MRTPILAKLSVKSLFTKKPELMRLYTNENFPLPAAQVLRECGHDVLTIQEAGYAG